MKTVSVFSRIFLISFVCAVFFYLISYFFIQKNFLVYIEALVSKTFVEAANPEIFTKEQLQDQGLTADFVERLNSDNFSEGGRVYFNNMETSAVYVKKSTASNTYAFSKINYSFFNSLLYSSNIFFYVICIFAILLGTLVLMTTLFAYRPLKLIRQDLENILVGKYYVKSGYESKDDIGLITMALKKMCIELEQKSKALEAVSDLAFSDSMTGLKNYRAFKEEFQKTLATSRRHKFTMSLVILDVDFFKKFNDKYGHQQGDEVLKVVASVLKKSVRETDFAARYGGEEFILILPQTDMEGCLSVAEKVRKNIESTLVQKLNSTEQLNVTVSLGGVTCLFDGTRDSLTMDNILEVADANLYVSKEKGRNKSTVSTMKQPSKLGNVDEAPSGKTS